VREPIDLGEKEILSDKKNGEQMRGDQGST